MGYKAEGKTLQDIPCLRIRSQLQSGSLARTPPTPKALLKPTKYHKTEKTTPKPLTVVSLQTPSKMGVLGLQETIRDSETILKNKNACFLRIPPSRVHETGRLLILADARRQSEP